MLDNPSSLNLSLYVQVLESLNHLHGSYLDSLCCVSFSTSVARALWSCGSVFTHIILCAAVCDQPLN